ncbi:hypothetical protein ABQE62_05955 [Mycolicibacterium fortuitum]
MTEINRRGRDTRLLRTASSAGLFAVTFAFAMTCGAAPAAADPGYCTAHPEDTSAICELVRNPPPTTPPTPKSGLDSVIDTIGHGAMGVGVVLVAILLIGWILANIFGTGYKEQRGRQIAEQYHQPAVAPASPAADPADFDPLGLGLAAPAAVPTQQPMPEPQLTGEDAQRYAKFGRPVDWIPGTAFASLTTRSGDWKAASTAWAAACEAGHLGETEQRASRIPGVNATRETYVPAADLVRINPRGNGDAEVVVKPLSIAVGADQLNAVVPLFLRTGRLRHGGRFTRLHATDEYLLVVSNRDITAEKPAPATTSTDDDWS